MLRVLNKDTDNAPHFPFTMSLINQISCPAVMFSILTPHAQLAPHSDPDAGVIRYHLGLKVPKDKENCFLVVNDKKLHWQEGHDLMFDETYIHSAENNTNERRVVLLLNIVPEYSNPIIFWLVSSWTKVLGQSEVADIFIRTINAFAPH